MLDDTSDDDKLLKDIKIVDYYDISIDIHSLFGDNSQDSLFGGILPTRDKPFLYEELKFDTTKLKINQKNPETHDDNPTETDINSVSTSIDIMKHGNHKTTQTKQPPFTERNKKSKLKPQKMII